MDIIWAKKDKETSFDKAKIEVATKEVRISTTNPDLPPCSIFHDISLFWLDSIDSRIESASWLSKLLPDAFEELMFTSRPGGRTPSGIKINNAFGFPVKKIAETAITARPNPTKVFGAKANIEEIKFFKAILSGCTP